MGLPCAICPLPGWGCSLSVYSSNCLFGDGTAVILQRYLTKSGTTLHKSRAAQLDKLSHLARPGAKANDYNSNPRLVIPMMQNSWSTGRANPAPASSFSPSAKFIELAHEKLKYRIQSNPNATDTSNAQGVSPRQTCPHHY